MSSIILVSACLLGLNCRYNAQSKLHPALLKQLRNKSLLVVCPEMIGGLPVPRPPVQLVRLTQLSAPAGQAVLKGQARLFWGNGRDVTRSFIGGAQKIMKLLKPLTLSCAYLKARSPSCGRGIVSSWIRI